MVVENFLRDLSNEIGFKFGSPWRYSDKSLGVIVPILKTGEIGERGYVTLEEAKDKGVIFKDTGHIDRVIIESSLGVPIFIRSGTALKSLGTQPRVVETSIVIVPEEVKKEEVPIIIAPKVTKQEIHVRCIHASKPIQSGEKFTPVGDVPFEVRAELLSRSGQSNTWAAVGHATNRFMASSRPDRSYGKSGGRSFFAASRLSSDNLVGVMEEVDKFQSDVDEILKKVPLFEDQVGAVFLDMKDVLGIELFDHPKSWEAIHKEVEKRLGEAATKEEEKTFFKPDYEQISPMIFSFLKKLIESDRTETSHGIASTVSLKGDGVVGEATTINGKVIHLVGIKIEKAAKEKVNKTVRNMASINDAIRHRATSSIFEGIRV